MLRCPLGDDAGEEAGFAVLELDDLLGGTLADNGLVTPQMVTVPAWERTSILSLRATSWS